MPQDARNKLRQMGGILSSYPELIQAAQGPTAGGGVAAVERGAPTEGWTFNDWQQMSRGQREDYGLPVSTIGGQLFFDRFGVGLGIREPDARYTAEGPVPAPPPARAPYTNDPSIVAPSATLDEIYQRMDELALEEPNSQTLREMQALKDAELEAHAALREARQEAGDARPVDPKPAAAEQLIGVAPPLRGPAGSDASAPQKRPRARPTRPEDAALAQSMADRAIQLMQPPPDDDEKTLRERYDEQMALINEVFGEEKADNRAMDLAMIGLSILAAEGPNAINNIARGALSGLQSIGARRDAERERETSLKALALEGAIDSMSSEANARAEAARMQQELTNDVALEEAKALIAAEYGTGESAPTGSTVLNSVTSITKMLVDQGLVDTGQEALLIARRAIEELYGPNIFPTASPAAPATAAEDDYTPEELALIQGE